MLIRCPAMWVLRGHCLGPHWIKTQWVLGCRQRRQAASRKSTCSFILIFACAFRSLQKLPPVALPDQSPQRPGRDTPAHEPYPGRPGSEVLANMTANQNIWPGGSWGVSPPALRSVPAYLKRHKSGQLLASDGEAMHKAPLGPGAYWPGRLPRQELIGRAAPHPHIYPWQCTAAASGQRGGAA